MRKYGLTTKFTKDTKGFGYFKLRTSWFSCPSWWTSSCLFGCGAAAL